MEEKNELSLKEKQSIILEIMKDIAKFCRANNIPYTLSSGTLLGAVRHGGFIPWDDDADMFMLREDFDRFVNIYKSDKYHLLFNTRSDDEFFASGYAKVNDPDTFIAESLTMTNHGVFVDIFPLDGVPDDAKERKEYMHKIMSLHNRIYHRQRKDLLSIIKSYRHPLDWWMNKMNETVHDPRYVNSPLVAHVVGTTNYRTVIDRDRFKSLVDIPFEGYNFLGFSDTDSYLSMVYGPDYMTPKKWSHNLKVYRKNEQ
ncbi:MAG: LicD family protein [Muribaculaceae bacterium]|nr:LicD family protein [Muribaculaceae bacterium]